MNNEVLGIMAAKAPSPRLISNKPLKIPLQLDILRLTYFYILCLKRFLSGLYTALLAINKALPIVLSLLQPCNL